MSVIFRADGLEFRVTFLTVFSALALSNGRLTSPPASSTAEDFRMSRRLSFDLSQLNISISPFLIRPSAKVPAANEKYYELPCHRVASRFERIRETGRRNPGLFPQVSRQNSGVFRVDFNGRSFAEGVDEVWQISFSCSNGNRRCAAVHRHGLRT